MESEGTELNLTRPAEAIVSLAREVEEINSGRLERAPDVHSQAQNRSNYEALKDTIPALVKRLKKLGLARVNLEIAEGVEWQGVFENVHGNLKILIGATSDGMKTLNHEVIHALRDMKVSTDKE